MMNEQADLSSQSAPASLKANDLPPMGVPQGDERAEIMAARAGGCESCGYGTAPDSTVKVGTAVSFVYAIGRIEARFPNLAAEKEFAQATGRTDTVGKTDQQAFHAVLSKRENRYLIRQLCWVLVIHGLETYLLMPRDPADIDLLVEAIRPTPTPQ